MKLAIDSMHCTMWQGHNGANLTYDKQIHQYRFVEDMAVSVLRKPSIFVSSTCFDLKQIRADIKTFIENDLSEPNCEASSEEKITLVLTPPDTGKINEEIKKILAMQAYSGNM